MNKNPDTKSIDICIKTWTTDSNGIFNFKSESSQIRQVNDIISKNCYMIKKRNNKIKKVEQNSEYNDLDGEILFHSRKSFKTNQFEIVNPIRKLLKKNEYNLDSLNTRMWYIVKSRNDSNGIDNEDYNLNENDIIKLGRRKFEIIKKNINANNENSFNDPGNYNISEINKKAGSIFDINLPTDHYRITENKKEKKEVNDILKSTNNTEEISYSNSNDKDSDFKMNSLENLKEDFANDENDEIESEKCRICFDVISSKDNPKICLCQCKDFIHYECLKRYMSTKLEIHENEKGTVKTYACNKFNCDVCLAPYPIRFRIAEFNRIYELIDLNMPSELDYVILESLDFIKDNGNIKTVHIVELNDDEIQIGRYDTNDIIDIDISVSRRHAIMKYNKETGKLFLENLSEKFGTLVLIKGNIKMKEKKIHFQVGKSYIAANLVENSYENKINNKKSNDTDNSENSN